MMKVNGDNGQLDASKIIKKFVVSIFDAKLLAQFTWSGKSGEKGVRKFVFKDYKSIVQIIRRTMMACDSSYTELQFEQDMVKKVMKVAYKGADKRLVHDTAVSSFLCLLKLYECFLFISANSIVFLYFIARRLIHICQLTFSRQTNAHYHIRTCQSESCQM